MRSSAPHGFADRRAAGRELASRLAVLAPEQPLVLGLARGGIPVAYEIAQTLGAPLDVLVARKIGAPGEPRVRHRRDRRRRAADARHRHAAVAEDQRRGPAARPRAGARGGRRACRALSRRSPARDHGADRDRRRRRYRHRAGPRARRSTRSAHGGRGAWYSRSRSASRPPSGTLAAVADEVVCLAAPEQMRAVGAWYEDFSQTTDDEVLTLARGPAVGRTGDRVAQRGDPRADRRDGQHRGGSRVPPGATGLVIFAHGSGSSRLSPRNRDVAATLNDRGLATLLIDLLTPTEAAQPRERVRHPAARRTRRSGGAVGGGRPGRRRAPGRVLRRKHRGRRPRCGPRPISAAVSAPWSRGAGVQTSPVRDWPRCARRCS